MSDDVNVFEVDQARYITFGAVLKALDPEVTKRIKSVSSVANKSSSSDTSNPAKKLSYKLAKNDVFMGICVHHVGIPPTNPKSIRLTFEEISLNGTRGSKFFLTLYNVYVEEWLHNSTLKTAMNGGKLMIIFQNIPHQITKSGEIQFHFASNKNGSWIKLKNYFSSLAEAQAEKYIYVTLKTAADNLARKCHMYAIVHSILQEPKEASKGKGYGLYCVVDPSCYENMVKVREYTVHVFTTSLAIFPKIVVGDIIRMHRAVTEHRPRDEVADFRVFRETDFIVFPWNDQERPRCLASRFTFTEDDIVQLKYLKAWSLERYRQHLPVSTMEPKIITLSEIKPADTFDLPCRLVEFFDEDQGVAMWVEDGTKCPLFTCSDTVIQPFDSQDTQLISNDCSRICVRSSKQLLGDIKLERQMLLYLREVKTTLQNCGLEDAALFEIRGAVESLPLNTRYHKSLLQRLEKSQVERKEVEPKEKVVESGLVHPSESPQDQVDLDQPIEQQFVNRQLSNDQPKEKSAKEQPIKEQSVKERQSKEQPAKEQLSKLQLSDEQPSESEPVKKPSTGQSTQKKPLKANHLEDFKPRQSCHLRIEIELDESPQRVIKDLSPQIVVETSTESGILQSSGNKMECQKDQIKSSGECSTDREMKEIPSDFFALPSPPFQINVSEEIERETSRLHQLVHSEVEEDFAPSQVLSRPAAQSQNLASLEDMNFSQVVASTQKQAPYIVDESNDADESSLSQEITNAQRLFSSGTESDSSCTKSPVNIKPVAPIAEDNLSRSSSSLSPHPSFRAVNEVLEIKTNCLGDGPESDNENQMNISIDAPLFRHRQGDGDHRVCLEVTSKSHESEISMVTSSNFTRKRYKKVVERITSFGDDRREELVLTISDDKSNRGFEDVSVRKKVCRGIIDQHSLKSPTSRHFSSSSSSSVVEICQDEFQMSQESDGDSVLLLDPASQDLEKLFCAVEQAQPVVKHIGDNLAEIDTIEPGEHFRMSVRIKELLPKQPNDDVAGLKSLLIAYCEECSHLWQYNHFIGSISQRVMHPRNPPLVSAENEDDEFDWGAINYLCSEEDHTRNMLLLTESEFPNIDAFEYDDNVTMDRSYSFICPMCKSRGVPDTLCALKPSFFFRLHATQNIGHDSNCLHILASGRHAEYFLGTKADHVLRSQEVWKRAEQRIAKLVQSKQPLTLALRRYEANPKEIYLENTKNVYTSNHLLPW